MNSCRSPLITWKAPFEVIPSMFNGTEVWRLSRPVKKLDTLLLKPNLGPSGCMLGVIILLKDDFTFRDPRILHALQQSFLQMATYCSASIFPSTSLKTPTPFHPIQPQTISDPSPNLTVPLTSLEISPSPFLFHTYSDPILLILVSSDRITLF